MPHSLKHPLGSFYPAGATRHEDEPEFNSPIMPPKKPRFHLLIPATTPGSKLCKTILSAAVLRYPVPTLIQYNISNEDQQTGGGSVRKIANYLLSKEVQLDDLVLIVDDDTWFQLPAEIMIHRFERSTKKANTYLHEKYGGSRARGSKTAELQMTSQQVLFGADRGCSVNSATYPQCFGLPAAVDYLKKASADNLRYLDPSTAIGRVSNVVPIFTAAADRMSLSRDAGDGFDVLLGEMFGEQEIHRADVVNSISSTGSKWKAWLAKKLGTNTIALQNATAVLPAQKYEYGIAIDIEHNVFQSMAFSKADVEMLQFNDTDVVAGIVKTTTNATPSSITIPADLSRMRPPFQLQARSPQESSAFQSDLDHLPTGLLWSDVNLMTNIGVPGSSIPTALHFNKNEPHQERWSKMWYQPYARSLLRQYIRSPQGTVAAEAAAEGGDRWWDLRGGKGGVWTDGGEFQ